jgi:hypothetical protein
MFLLEVVRRSIRQYRKTSTSCVLKTQEGYATDEVVAAANLLEEPLGLGNHRVD